MKKFFAAFIVLLAATSCANESLETGVENNAEQATAPVRVRVSNFSITTEEMPSGGGTTRAAENPGGYFEGGAITLAFYDAAGHETYKTTQIKGDGTYTTFGEFTANLPVGHYTMVAVARYYYAGDAFTLTNPTAAAYTSERPRETFTKVQSVTVTSATPLDLDVTLNRISSWLKIISTDGRPASAIKIKTTFAKGGKSFDPSTGLATVDTGFWQTNNPSTAVGATIEVNAVPLLYTDEESMNITIEVLDADENVIGTKVVNNVPFKRNRVTKLTGAVFTAGTSGAGFKLETTWLSDYNMDF
jgi:hypothetical protein